MRLDERSCGLGLSLFDGPAGEEEEHHGHEEQRENRRRGQPADDGERERLIRLGAALEPQRGGNEADDGRQAGHRDRDEARARGGDDRLELVDAPR